ncbi:MAG: hypothetical protein WBI13_01310 [Synechococcus sp.]|jgi:hypothetical protein|nr:hypothetical protein [Cyanobacteriota bacterium]MDA7491279.1 hypothetical protein [Synechococcus sp. AH-707-M23]MDC0260883.1 hypothetical protein [Synechococcus sp. AH-551-N17]NCG16681.1 hypothetical protein [Synechococcales cyanobacterium H12SWP_bin.12]
MAPQQLLFAVPPPKEAGWQKIAPSQLLNKTVSSLSAQQQANDNKREASTGIVIIKRCDYADPFNDFIG